MKYPNIKTTDILASNHRFMVAEIRVARRKIGRILNEFPRSLSYPMKVYQLSKSDPDRYHEVIALEELIKTYQESILKLKRVAARKPAMARPAIKVTGLSDIKEIIMDRNT